MANVKLQVERLRERMQKREEDTGGESLTTTKQTKQTKTKQKQQKQKTKKPKQKKKEKKKVM
jgi:hypothetical protein